MSGCEETHGSAEVQPSRQNLRLLEITINEACVKDIKTRCGAVDQIVLTV